MAGHSQFKNIMHRKGAQDAKRAKMFAKIVREITVSVKSGAPDPDMNPRLRLALQAARSANMPKDNVERAIKKAQGSDSDTYDEIRYEGYGPSGIAVIVEAMTDNKNRTASDIRSTFTKSGGNLGETGSVSYLFDKIGVIEYPLTLCTFDDAMNAALEAGADDVIAEEEVYQIICPVQDLHEVSKQLEAILKNPPSKAQVIWKPQALISVDDEIAEKLFKLIDTLEDHDDVQHVYTNFNVSDDFLARLKNDNS